MNSPRLRIFNTSSHVCTVYLTMLARETRQAGDIDILFLDAGARRKGSVEVILQTAKLHEWAKVHDFSISFDESKGYKPSTRKVITRRIKAWPVIRSIYNFLLASHMKSQDKKYRPLLSEILDPFIKDKKSIEIFQLTQTALNRQLMQLFPDASINYIEHGVIDYLFVLKPETPKGNFYGVFAEQYKRYLQKRNLPTDWVRQIPGTSDFPIIADENILRLSEKIHFEQLDIPDKPCVFVVLEAVDIYYVKPTFWGEYMDRIFAQLPYPEKFHYLLKPHPMQSEESLTATIKHFDSLGYQYTLLNQSSMSMVCAEVLFTLWKKKIEHVFCLFSAACFYLSLLYANEKIKFWYSTDFMRKHADKAPPDIHKAFLGACELIEEVFVDNCTAYK